MTMTIGALPARVSLDLYQGDDFAFTVTVTGLSLAGVVAAAQLRHHPGAPILATFAVTVDETLGTIALSLSAVDTAALIPGAAVWDLQISTGGRIRTLVGGAVKIAAEVTL